MKLFLSAGILTLFMLTILSGCGGNDPSTTVPKFFAYVANRSSNDVSAYSINTATGALTAIAGSPFAAGTVPISVAVDPSGKSVYVANANSADVSAYTIDADGSLAAVPGSPFAAGAGPSSVTVDPSGKLAYVANNISSNVSAYCINANGSLTPIPGSPFAAGTNPNSIVTVRR
ncbi:MAG: beta-propeller fold lactonase family protein [Geobacteraceae bacterium]|jgi:6-phosphogluconolactonase (cycloisomerase 2 family)